MNRSIHIVHYKGYSIICENGFYRVATFPVLNYITLDDAKAEVDRVEAQIQSNLENLSTIVKRKTNQ